MSAPKMMFSMIHTAFETRVSPKFSSPKRTPQPVSGENTALMNDPS
ncbi:hypothetical protein [Elizabethkingia meningoseptica]|nr:hypothetical protein [Elizabethkingia meningoseptica]MEC4712399.1 hypothetical protein [Elizabethkingia meningoseptica]